MIESAEAAEGYSEYWKTSKMELFGKIAHSFYPSIIFVKGTVLDAKLGPDYTFEKVFHWRIDQKMFQKLPEKHHGVKVLKSSEFGKN